MRYKKLRRLKVLIKLKVLFLLFFIFFININILHIEIVSSEPNGIITYSGNDIYVIGFSVESPCSFIDVYNADKDGVRTLLVTSVGTGLTLTTQIQYSDETALKLNLTLYSSDAGKNDNVQFTGTDKDDNSQSETVLTESDGEYQTIKWFRTVTNIDCVGFSSGTIKIEQLQWGVVWKINKDQFFIDNTDLHIGNGVNQTFFFDTKKQVTIDGICNIEIHNNATFISGKILELTNKITTDGCSFHFLYRHEFITNDGSNLQLYGTQIIANMSEYLAIEFEGNVTIYGSMFDSIEHITFYYTSTVVISDFLITNMTQMMEFQTSSVTLENIRVMSAECLISLEKKFITVRDFYGRNATDTCIWVGSGGDIGDYYLIDTDIDDWSTLAVFVLYWAKCYRQYSFDITVFFENGTQFENANVTMSYYGQEGGKAFSVLTGSNGSFATKTLNMGFYNGTGQSTIYDFNPYNLTITYDGFETYSTLINITQKKDLSITLTPISITTDYSIVFLAIGLSIGICIAIVGVKLK